MSALHEHHFSSPVSITLTRHPQTPQQHTHTQIPPLWPPVFFTSARIIIFKWPLVVPRLWPSHTEAYCSYAVALCSGHPPISLLCLMHSSLSQRPGVPRLGCPSESSRGLDSNRLWAQPQIRTRDRVWLRRSLRKCPADRFPGDTAAWTPRFENQCRRSQFKCHFLREPSLTPPP